MTIGDLFSARLSISGQEQIIRQRGHNKNFKELEQKLSNIFYPEDESFNYEAMQNAVLNAEADDLVDLIMSNADAVIDGKINFTENKEFIYFSTLENAAKRAEETLHRVQEIVMSGSINSVEITNKLSQLTAILNEGKAQLQSLNSNYGGKILRAEIGDKNFSNISKTLNQLRAIGNLSSLGGYLQRRGLILEEIFGGGGSTSRVKAYDEFVDGMVQILANEGIEGIRTGQMTQRRGGSGPIYLAGIKAEGSKNKKIPLTEMASKISLGELGSINSTVKYDPGSARQIKADVEINFKTSNGHQQKFRASLKNWSGIENKHLGTTSILAAVDRVGGNRQLTNAYGLSLASTTPSLLLQAHRMARLSILMDIITGYSQNTGYADTLIINTGKAIKVIDPRELINDVYGKEFIEGYNESDLERTGQTILDNIQQRSPGRTKIYLGNIFTYLAATKVTVMMNRQLLA